MSKPNDAIIIPDRLVGHVREEALLQLGIVARRVSEASRVSTLTQGTSPDCSRGWTHGGNYSMKRAGPPRRARISPLTSATEWRCATPCAIKSSLLRLAPIPLSLRPRSHWQERASASARSGA
jgi:hypothetical protein